MPVTPKTTQQWTLIQQWVDSLKQIPELDVVWLEGSLTHHRGDASSDIDMRFGIADGAYEQLWEADRTALLASLGDYLLLETNPFVRALTKSGLLVEAYAHRTSQLNSLELYEWEILFSRLPAGQPTFRKMAQRSPAEVWPAREKVTVEFVRALTNRYLFLLANAPKVRRDDPYSAQYLLDMMRIELIKVMYHRLGLQFGKRGKELADIFPADWLVDLEQSYLSAGANPLDITAISASLIRLFGILGKHLHALSEQVGGGFEPEWYDRLYKQVTARLVQARTHALEQSM